MSWLLSAQFESETGVSELSHCHKFHENRQLDGKERSRGWKHAEWAQPVSDTTKMTLWRQWHLEEPPWKVTSGQEIENHNAPSPTWIFILKVIITKVKRTTGLQDTALKGADRTAKYFKGSLQAEVLLILTKSRAGHSSYTHVIINFRGVTSDIPHGKPQMIQIHSLLPEQCRWKSIGLLIMVKLSTCESVCRTEA